jgi:hypothetical protein
LVGGLTSASWPMIDQARIRSEGEAAFYQFQEQLEAIPAGLRAEASSLDYFEFLPPVGLVPIDLSLDNASERVKVRIAAGEALFDYSYSRSADEKNIDSTVTPYRRRQSAIRRKSGFSGSLFTENFFIDGPFSPDRLPYAAQLHWLIEQGIYYPSLGLAPDEDNPYQESGISFSVQAVPDPLVSGSAAAGRQYYALFWLNLLPAQLHNDQYLRKEG